MNKTAELRLGGSYDALRVHAFFDGFSWVNIIYYIIRKN